MDTESQAIAAARALIAREHLPYAFIGLYPDGWKVTRNRPLLYVPRFLQQLKAPAPAA